MKTASTTSPASAATPKTRPANFTRQTADLPRKFLRSGRWHLLALYHFIRLSDFGREGIERSGSYRFADHLYRNQASGKGWFGRWLDRRLLDLPSARGMRHRYVKAQSEILRALESRDGPLRLLAIPCGIPRDVSEIAANHPSQAARIHYTGMDLDPAVLAAAADHLTGTRLGSCALREGDALDPAGYQPGRFDFIVSTGLGEFLDDALLLAFYRHVFHALDDGGTFYTSATAWERKSDFLMKAFEMEAHYRDRGRIESLLRTLPWRSIQLEHDPTGLQTLVVAVK